MVNNQKAGPVEALESVFKKIDRFAHLASVAGWDQATMMPPGGARARAEALAEVQVHCHQLLTDPSVGVLLDRAEQLDIAPEQRASVREMRREWIMASQIPEQLVEAKSVAGAACEHAWRSQRPQNDWKGFLGNLEPVVERARAEAGYLSQALGLSKYDALMEKFEPGFGAARAGALFDDAMSWLPGMIGEAMDKQKNRAMKKPKGPFPAEAQKRLAIEAMGMLGFDFDRGRLDSSTHPFCGGVTQDVRITTAYDESDCLSALMGVVHETGHALYEQGLPRRRAGLPVGRARSMALHESQSLFHEMQIGAHKGFLGLIAPMLSKHYGERPEFDLDNLFGVATKVEPSLIRIHADELTYPAHIALRFGIEKALIEGEIEACDIPAMWDEGMARLLGVDTRGNYKDGPMQDIHWTDGSFGYFPSYTLGAMLAAQLFASMRAGMPGIDADIAAGDFAGVHGWLGEKIWSRGSELGTADLIEQATGAPLDAKHFKAHLAARYLD